MATRQSGPAFISRRRRRESLFKRCPLRLEQLLDPALPQLQHLGELGFAERGFFACALEFDKLTGRIHDKIEIHSSRGVFGIAEVQQGPVINNPNADSSYRM